MPPLPHVAPSVRSLQVDALTLGWQLWHALLGSAAPLA